jgi:hypothetical protein
MTTDSGIGWIVPEGHALQSRTMNRWLAVVLLACCAYAAAPAAAEIEATTADGRKVILRDDGTWSDPSAVSPARNLASKPAGATQMLQSKKGFMELWYDPSKWTQRTKFSNESAEFALEHTSGDAYAMVIVERISMPLSTLRKVALDNAKATAEDARISLEEERTINGVRITAMQIDGTFSGIPFRYYGYYWTGNAGTLQVVTFTSQNLFGEVAEDFTGLLNGVVITRN